MLASIIARKKKSLVRKKKSLKEALSEPQLSVIAEIKRASPSRGRIAEIEDPAARAALYVQGGAAAISVLTDEAFEGSLDDLRKVAQSLHHTNVPVFRKDFIVDPIQLFESVEAGADAVLLMVSILKEKTAEMVRLAGSIGLETLVEVHTLDELMIAVAAGAKIIGVNQRDLNDFSLHPEKFAELIEHIPDACIAVAESGISGIVPGYDAVLVGEALSRAEDPREILSKLRTQ